jgi:hypothetical protein
MHLTSLKSTVTAVWMASVGVAAVAGQARAPSTLAYLVGIAVLPPLAMAWFWRHPRPTLSESIQNAKR